MKTYSLNRISRIRKSIKPYVEFIEKKCPKKVVNSVEVELEKFKRIREKVYFWGSLRTFCYLLAYITLFSTIFSELYFLEEAFNTLAFISGIIGTGFLLLVIGFCTRMINIYVSDAHTIVSIVTSVAVKHGFIDPQE